VKSDVLVEFAFACTAPRLTLGSQIDNLLLVPKGATLASLELLPTYVDATEASEAIPIAFAVQPFGVINGTSIYTVDVDDDALYTPVGLLPPISADYLVDADASIADGLIGEQRAVSSTIAAQEEVADAAELKRVRVLRDGPMYGMPKQKRGTSLFRMRIEAKARIGNMVSASKVGYRGPTPTPAEFADATVAAATEAALDAGADPDGPITFTLRHVPQALATVANAAGIGPGYIDPFLFSAGVGLTSSGKKVDSPARLRLRISDDGAPNLDVRALEKEKTRAVSADELRQLCIEFQEYVAANPDANKPA
jgi:hypothetical protein